MTGREKHEIAVTVRSIMNDECNEIRDPWIELHGTQKGLREHVRKECVYWWTECDPYLDKEYLDISHIKMETGRIINLDDIWCYIRDDLKNQAKARRAEFRCYAEGLAKKAKEFAGDVDSIVRNGDYESSDGVFDVKRDLKVRIENLEGVVKLLKENVRKGTLRRS